MPFINMAWPGNEQMKSSRGNSPGFSGTTKKSVSLARGFQHCGVVENHQGVSGT